MSESNKKDNNSVNSDLVDIITIDDFVKECGLDRIDFIKADIEGTEWDMLKGAKETLKNMLFNYQYVNIIYQMIRKLLKKLYLMQILIIL